ncbi:MAG: type II toxin-antitoxin system RelE family toxin [Rhodospirillales bacterium]
MKLEFERAAVHGLADMPPGHRRRLLVRLEQIARDPFAHHANVKALKGSSAGFRVRQGDWRAVYRVDRTNRTVFVEAVGPRGNVYDD